MKLLNSGLTISVLVPVSKHDRGHKYRLLVDSEPPSADSRSTPPARQSPLGGSHRLKIDSHRQCELSLHTTQINTVIMSARTNEQTILQDQQKYGFNADPSNAPEFISVPVGSFAGTLERILRIRDGKRVPADTGDQGGGQN
jgi:hypothetical protein